MSHIACTTRRSTSSGSTAKIAWERLTPASPAASARSLRPVNFKNGRKFDTTQNSDDVAHVPVSESRNPRTLDPSASPEVGDPARLQEHQIGAAYPAVGVAGGQRQVAVGHVGVPCGSQRGELARDRSWATP